MTVLIVEDDSQCRQMLKETIEAYGCEVDAPETLDDALRILSLGHVDAVLSDGLEGLWLRPFTEAVKLGKAFVLLSGDGRQIEAARNLGVRAYLKPHSIREILGELGCPSPAEPMADATGEP
jgi:DNA-binding response OmpR family regulator